MYAHIFHNFPSWICSVDGPVSVKHSVFSNSFFLLLESVWSVTPVFLLAPLIVGFFCFLESAYL